MPVFAALLRGVNVGGRHSLPSTSLLSACEAADLSEPRVYLQSGNVVFRSGIRSKEKLAARFRESIRTAANLDVAVLLRTRTELEEIVAANPFGRKADAAPNRLIVLFLEGLLPATAERVLEKERSASEQIACVGREVYAWFGDGMGRSKLAAAFTPRKLGVDCTARNWNTVQALLRLAQEVERRRR